MRQGVHPVVWGFILLLFLVEITLRLGETGFVPDLRHASLLLAVGSIPPSVAVQSMPALFWFLAGLFGYSLLHGSWMHLILNAVGILCLGHVVQVQAGTKAFILAAFLTALGGAVAFLLIAGNAIMIGASGIVFGLLGIVLRWRARRLALWRVLVVLALISLPAGLIFEAEIAWQAHLGGFLTGWLLAPYLPIRRRMIHPLM